MRVTVGEAAAMSALMGAVIFFCRAFPFLFFANSKLPNSVTPNLAPPGLAKRPAAGNFFDFVERIVPPAAMTVLTFNALGPSFGSLGKFISGIFIENASSFPAEYAAILCASVLTVLLHLWKRNPLISIFGGTAVYMAIQNFGFFQNSGSLGM